MCAMGPGEVIELFPLGQFGVEIDVSSIAEQLIELLLIGPMGSFDLSVRVQTH